jgi:hypothetical protein
MLDSTHCFITLFALCIGYTLYLFMIKPLNKRYEAALNHLLAKEIARRIYQELHPEFYYEKYHVDNPKHQAILEASIEEIRKLQQKNMD